MGGFVNNTPSNNDNRSLDRALLTATLETNSSTATTHRLFPESGRALTSIERRERLIAILDEALSVINVSNAPMPRVLQTPTTQAFPLARD
jgi:hypothetical protein